MLQTEKYSKYIRYNMVLMYAFNMITLLSIKHFHNYDHYKSYFFLNTLKIKDESI